MKYGKKKGGEEKKKLGRMKDVMTPVPAVDNAPLVGLSGGKMAKGKKMNSGMPKMDAIDDTPIVPYKEKAPKKDYEKIGLKNKVIDKLFKIYK